MDTSFILIFFFTSYYLFYRTYLSKLSFFSFSISRCITVSMNHFYIYNYSEMADVQLQTWNIKLFLNLQHSFFFFFLKNTVCNCVAYACNCFSSHLSILYVTLNKFWNKILWEEINKRKQNNFFFHITSNQITYFVFF